MIALILIALASAASAAPLDFPKCIGEGKPGYVTLCWSSPDYCEESPSVYCDRNACPDKTCNACPGRKRCVAGEGLVPTALSVTVTAVSKGRVCAGGVSAGDSCEVDADCPSSTCGGDVLMASTSYTPSTSCHSVRLGRTCLAGANIGKGCSVDGDCPSSTCAGSWVHRVAVATKSRSEHHALTACTPETGCDERRFCVERQRWAAP